MGSFWQSRTSSERRILLLGAIVLVICVPLLLTPPASGNKKLLSAREARQQYIGAEAEKRQKDAEVVRLKPEIERLVYKDAPETVIPTVIRSLQTTAARAGIHIREIKPQRARKLAGLTKVPLSVRFSCDFARTVPFLYEVEDPAGKLVVDRLNVTAPDAKTRMVDVEAHVAFFTKHAAASTETAGTAGT